MSKVKPSRTVNTIVGDTVFERELVNIARSYRQRAADCDINSLDIRISVSGRVDGDLKITFEIGEPYSDYGYVKGNTIENVFDEMLRRRGWNERHRPLCLPNVDGAELRDGDDD